jgi:hypothetical protein
VTIEDPVEFAISSFRQMGVDPWHNVTMSTGLRTLLCMDPDVVLVREIHDAETADIAMRAASSGKRVRSTFHTRDVPSTVRATASTRRGYPGVYEFGKTSNPVMGHLAEVYSLQRQKTCNRDTSLADCCGTF